MIHFRCEYCGRKFRVPDSIAGKKAVCLKCKNIVVVPQIEGAKSVANQPETGTSEIESKDSILDPNLFDIPQKSGAVDTQGDVPDQALENLRKLKSDGTEREPPSRRKLPWLIDIFLYPANSQGMIFLAIAVLVPLIIRIAALFLCVFGLLFLLLNIAIVMYIYWFLAQCVRDSAAGGLRAPETMAETPDLGELIWQVLELFACFVLYGAAAGVYFWYTHKLDNIFWLLAGCNIFLYPMALLAMVMFESTSGLNPLVIIPSIFSTFFQYCGLIILIAAIIFLYIRMLKFLPSNPYAIMLLSPLVQAVGLYFAMIAAHLLGRFYFKYQEKLNWEV